MSSRDTVTDALGRKLEIKSFSSGDHLALLEAAQGQTEYKSWLEIASLIFMRVAVDGVPLPRPRKLEDFKKNLLILKSEGVESIITHLSSHKQNGMDEAKQIETIKAIVEQPYFREIVKLIKFGVPYNMAFSISPVLRNAFLIAIGKQEGGFQLVNLWLGLSFALLYQLA